MSEMDMKLYPKTSKDAGWIKFYFDYQDKHYTIRPAWKPILMLEAKFGLLWGKDFKGAYEAATNKTNHAESNILIRAALFTTELLETFEAVSKMGRSPFVIYIKSRNEFKQ